MSVTGSFEVRTVFERTFAPGETRSRAVVRDPEDAARRGLSRDSGQPEGDGDPRCACGRVARGHREPVDIVDVVRRERGRDHHDRPEGAVNDERREGDRQFVQNTCIGATWKHACTTERSRIAVDARDGRRKCTEGVNVRGARPIHPDVRSSALLRFEAERRAAKRADLQMLARTVAMRCGNAFVVLDDRGAQVLGTSWNPQG